MPAAALDLHPTHDGTRYALQGVFVDASRADATTRRHADLGKAILRFDLAAPSGRTLRAVAARDLTLRQRRARIPQARTVPWQAVRLALEAFRLAERTTAAAGTPLRWYKHLEETKLRDVMTSHRFQGSRLDVAARLLSRTILAHPFPNANHRTSLSFARMYLRSEGVEWPPYSLRGRGIDRLIRETDPYILHSKYLLQLRRRLPLVQVAYAEGFRALEVKAGQVVAISPEDLGLTAEQTVPLHEGVCRLLLSTVAGEKLAADLAAPASRDLREMVALARRR